MFANMNSLLRLRFKFSQAYKILGISTNCTIEEVKTAYYRKAQIYHPDKNSDFNAKDRFGEINKAYQEICATHKNKSAGGTQTQDSASWTATANAYKQQHQQQQQQQYSQSRRAQQARTEEYYTDFMNQIFDRIRRTKQRAREARQKQYEEYDIPNEQPLNPRRNSSKKRESEKEKATSKASLDIHTKVEVTAQELLKGCTKQFTIKKTVECECRSNQPHYEENEGNCKICRGTGFVTDNMPGYGRVDQMCFRCNGSGESKSGCRICRGKGIINIEVLQKLKIPKKSESNTTLKFEGKGRRSSTKVGDLYIRLVAAVKGERINNDIHSKENISVAESVLGTEVQIDTLFGKKTVSIPRGVKQGETITLSGYGYEKDKGKFGNHYVTINIAMPHNLSSREQQLYAELLAMQRSKGHAEDDE